MIFHDAAILVVDDEPVLRTTFAIVLKQLGATVHTAADGIEALEVLARERVDVLLTDKQMPRMNGTTLLRTLHERGASLPSIFFVSGVEAENVQELARWGVVETVTKPLHPERLKALLEKVLLSLRSQISA